MELHERLEGSGPVMPVNEEEEEEEEEVKHDVVEEAREVHQVLPLELLQHIIGTLQPVWCDPRVCATPGLLCVNCPLCGRLSTATTSACTPWQPPGRKVPLQ
jgi:hypothetical protein